jgi:hypothetical protein
MLTETQDNEEIIARVAALDIGKAELVCCVRVPDEDQPGRRLQEVETYSTMTRPLLGMAGHLRCLEVTRVVMEAPWDYWKPALPAGGGRVRDLAGERQRRQAPARAAQTDKLDAVWLAKVAERQMIRPSFVPPPEIRRLRDVTRYRADLAAARTAEKQRAEKLLEDAQIKLSVVASDIFGVSGRQMLAALIAGERDPGCSRRWRGPRSAARSPRCRRPSPATSPATTRSCWRRCWRESTRSTPTSPRGTPRSRR